VEDVVVREGKRKKGSALVVMASDEGAAAAAAAGEVHGDPRNPLLVVPLAKVSASSFMMHDA
jgi:DnaJ family protein C protein 17